jgi:hypothetical protein
VQWAYFLGLSLNVADAVSVVLAERSTLPVSDVLAVAAMTPTSASTVAETPNFHVVVLEVVHCTVIVFLNLLWKVRV